jgi:hypothetical protein
MSKQKQNGSERNHAIPKAPPLFREELIVKQLDQGDYSPRER